MSIRKIPSGFTVIELLVSLGIFAVISAVVMVNFNAGSRSTDLRLAGESVISYVRDVESRAVNGALACLCGVIDPETASVCVANACPGGAPTAEHMPLGGWGIHVETGQAQIRVFADVNGNFRMENDEVVSEEALSFSGGVIVQSVSCSSPLDIVFTPPNGTARLNAVESTAACTIVLEQRLNGDRRTVEFDPFSRRIEARPL